MALYSVEAHTAPVEIFHTGLKQSGNVPEYVCVDILAIAVVVFSHRSHTFVGVGTDMAVGGGAEYLIGEIILQSCINSLDFQSVEH